MLVLPLVDITSSSRHGGASPSLARLGGDLPLQGGEATLQGLDALALSLGSTMEDMEWQDVSSGLSGALNMLGMLRDVVTPAF